MLVSIHINSNKINNVKKFLDSYEKNASDLSCFEIIINTDPDDNAMHKFLEREKKNRSFILKYINCHVGDYFSGHINTNRLLEETNNKAYFVANVSDRACVKTTNWDLKLGKYKDYYKDHIFRIKCSKFKKRTYHDFWECCFAPANIFFTTKRLLDLTFDWSPCFSHDAFQQCVMYYLEKDDNFNANQINRDLYSDGIEFEGNEPIEKNEDENYKRIHGQIANWNILTSPKTQREAKRRALILKANILYFDRISEVKINDTGKHIIIKDNKKINKDIKYNYSVKNLDIILKNFIRKMYFLNYTGSGFNENSYTIFFSIFWYLNFRYKKLRGIKDLYNKYFGKLIG